MDFRDLSALVGWEISSALLFYLEISLSAKVDSLKTSKTSSALNGTNACMLWRTEGLNVADPVSLDKSGARTIEAAALDRSGL